MVHCVDFPPCGPIPQLPQLAPQKVQVVVGVQVEEQGGGAEGGDGGAARVLQRHARRAAPLQVRARAGRVIRRFSN